jgi:hypothetical protein
VVNRSKTNHHVRIALGVFLLILGALGIFNALYYHSFSMIFWFCFLSVPLVGIGLLISSTALIKSQLYILAIPDLVWCIDFFYYLFNGHSLLGIVDYFFTTTSILPKIITLQHIILVPIIFYSLVLLKNKEENSWKISIFQLIIIFILARIFTSPDVNINCVYNLCGNFSINLNMVYVLFWFTITFLMVYISRKIFIGAHKIFRKFFDITSQI